MGVIDYDHRTFRHLFFLQLEWLSHVCSTGDSEGFSARGAVDVELSCRANRAYANVAGIADGKIVGRRASRGPGITGRAEDREDAVGVSESEALPGAICLPADCFPIRQLHSAAGNL